LAPHHAENMARSHTSGLGSRLPYADIPRHPNRSDRTLTGLNPVLVNSSGAPWTGDFINVTGDLPADLLSNIAAEQRAKVVYEYLYRQIDDKHVRQMIDFLLNRVEAHNALFREPLNKLQKSGFNPDFGVDEDARLYFDLSTPDRYFERPTHTSPSFETRRQERTPQRPQH